MEPQQAKKTTGGEKKNNNLKGKEYYEGEAFVMANGRMEKRDAKNEILRETDNFAAVLHIIDEAGLFDVTARMRMGQNIIKIAFAFAF